MAAKSPEAKAHEREYQRNYKRRQRAAQKAGVTPPEPLSAEQREARRRETWRRSAEKNREKRNADSREYGKKNRDRINERRRQRRAQLKANDPEKLRYEARHGYAAGRRFAHGPDFFEMWARMWEEQGGKCYLCGDPLPEGSKTHVDHDHACCPKGKSCSFCRRGLACDRCNHVIGEVLDNPDLLRRIADNFEPVNTRTKARLASRPDQGALWEEAS